MCGIAGIFVYHYAAPPLDRDEPRAIRDHMVARGPNGLGEWFADNGRVALGHRRLAIIDLSDRASQPGASADSQSVISFNGEIHDYRELKEGLEACGRVFRTGVGPKRRSHAVRTARPVHLRPVGCPQGHAVGP